MISTSFLCIYFSSFFVHFIFNLIQRHNRRLTKLEYGGMQPNQKDPSQWDNCSVYLVLTKPSAEVRTVNNKQIIGRKSCSWWQQFAPRQLTLRFLQISYNFRLHSYCQPHPWTDWPFRLQNHGDGPAIIIIEIDINPPSTCTCETSQYGVLLALIDTFCVSRSRDPAATLGTWRKAPNRWIHSRYVLYGHAPPATRQPLSGY